MPKQINTPSPGQTLVKWFALKGRFQPVLDEVIVPVVVVPTETPTTRRIAGWGLAQGLAGAGNQNVMWIANPVNSGSLVVITRLWLLGGIANDFYTGVFETAGGVTGLGEWHDSRLGDKPQARLLATAGAAIVLGFPQYPADGSLLSVEWIIEPGKQLRLQQNQQNTTLDMSVEWHEEVIRTGTTFG